MDRLITYNICINVHKKGQKEVLEVEEEVYFSIWQEVVQKTDVEPIERTKEV